MSNRALTDLSKYELVAMRTTLLRGSVLSKYCTEEERDEWREKAQAITAELTRRKELPNGVIF